MADKKKVMSGTPVNIFDKLSSLNIILAVVIVVLFIIVIILLFRDNCETESEIIEEEIEGEFQGVASGFCKENVIPEKVVFKILLKEVEVGPRLYDKILSTWKDGTPIYTLPIRDENLEVRCHIGDPRNGEKNEYFYCNNLHYVRTPVDKEGNPGQTVEYLVDLVLDRDNYEIMHNHPEGWVGTIDLKVVNKVIGGKCKNR